MSYFSEEDFKGVGTALACMGCFAAIGMMAVVGFILWLVYWLVTHLTINWT